MYKNSTVKAIAGPYIYFSISERDINSRANNCAKDSICSDSFLSTRIGLINQ